MSRGRDTPVQATLPPHISRELRQVYRSRRRIETEFEFHAAVSFIGQVRPLYAVLVHSAVWISTWLYTTVDICVRIVFTRKVYCDSIIPREIEIDLVFDWPCLPGCRGRVDLRSGRSPITYQRAIMYTILTRVLSLFMFRVFVPFSESSAIPQLAISLGYQNEFKYSKYCW